MTKKGLIITYGEYGHKRWKRYDFLQRHYDINNEEQFKVDMFINETQKKAYQNKKELEVIYIKQWANVLRVYYKINNLKLDIWNKEVIKEEVNG